MLLSSGRFEFIAERADMQEGFRIWGSRRSLCPICVLMPHCGPVEEEQKEEEGDVTQFDYQLEVLGPTRWTDGWLENGAISGDIRSEMQTVAKGG